jgi:hypothetical protein
MPMPEQPRCCCQFDPSATPVQKTFVQRATFSVSAALPSQTAKPDPLALITTPISFSSPPLQILQCVWRC